MTNDTKKICGTCIWYSRMDYVSDCFECINPSSDFEYYETAYNDTCEDWEAIE